VTLWKFNSSFRNVTNNYIYILYLAKLTVFCLSRWPCRLRRGSGTIRLLGLRVRIVPVALKSAFFYIFRCQIEVSATSQSLDQTSPAECGVSECNLETSTTRKPRPTRAVELWKTVFSLRVMHTVWFHYLCFLSLFTKYLSLSVNTYYDICVSTFVLPSSSV